MNSKNTILSLCGVATILGASYSDTAEAARRPRKNTIRTVQWQVTSQSVSESIGTARVTAVLSGTTSTPVSVPFSLSGTASASSDYIAPSGTLTIPAGALSGSVSISIINDTTVESTESVILSMGAPVGANRGTNTTHTLSITDNDVAPAPSPTVSPQPSPTPTPTATVTPSPTPTATATPAPSPTSACIAAPAGTYYVDSTIGSDTNNGTNTCTPWKSLAKVNAVTLNAGNKILLKRGSTFYGSLSARFSGASGSPITYGAYGTGPNPVITGLSSVSGWTSLGGNIWESNSAVSSANALNMVLVNGVNTAMGRFPNAGAANGGYITFQSHMGNTSITSSALSGTPNWVGAEVVIRNGNFMMERSSITAHSAGTLNFSPGTNYENINGYGFFIQNDPRTLDQQNEWYYSPTTKKLRIYSVSAPTDVRVPTIDTLFNNSGSFVVLDSIDLTGSNGTSIYSGGSSVTIKNCNVSFSGIDYLSASGADQNVTDNTFLNANNNGVSVNGSRVLIARNTIRNTGTFHGMGQSRGNGINSALAFGATGARDYVVEGNRIFNSGLNGMAFYAENVVVKNNFIDTFGFILDDGAGIYTFTGGSRPLLTNVKIQDNIILNGIGAPQGALHQFPAAGIYTDEQSSGIEISGNSIANVYKYGIFQNICSNINIHDNTVYNSSIYQHGVAWSTNISNTRNTFVSKAAQNTLFISAGTSDIPRTFISDYNIYARPVDDAGKTFHVSQPSEYGRENKSLTEWKTFSSRDANTRGTPIAAASDNDIVFEYNATLTPKTIPLSTPMMSMNGTRYSTSITLQPFTSVVLIKIP